MQTTTGKLKDSGGANGEKTPEKATVLTSQENQTSPTGVKETENHKLIGFVTPKKSTAHISQENQVSATAKEETDNRNATEFTTPKKTKDSKSSHESPKTRLSAIETPEKKAQNSGVKSEETVSCDGEDELISTVEQARLLIAASKTPSKSGNRTPAKQGTPSGKRSIENSPVTPGKFRRVELITLASPKAKRIKQM